MGQVASRELRNNTADVLRRVKAGEEITITVRGEAVAQVVPIRRSRRHWITREELIEKLERIPYDPTFAEDLKWISGDTSVDRGAESTSTTSGLPPLRRPTTSRS